MQRVTPARAALVAAVLVVLGIAGLLRLTDSNLARAQTQLLTAVALKADPGTDPDGLAWASIPSADVPLTAQNIVYPNGGGTVPRIQVQAAHFNDTLFVRLEWEDDLADESSFAVEAFSDGVAAMFPAQSAASVPAITMGQADAGVNIWYWRADSEAGVAATPAQVYEGGFVDDYPLADDPVFNTARAAGNVLEAGGSVQELIARGFGSLTPAVDPSARGQGRYADGRWSVVLSRPFASADPERAVFDVGTTTDVAFAVWDGDNGDRNGQKSISQFGRLEVAPAVAIGAADGGDRDLTALIGFAVGAPLALLLGMGVLYLAIGRNEDAV